jgi:hypothetical protein
MVCPVKPFIPIKKKKVFYIPSINFIFNLPFPLKVNMKGLRRSGRLKMKDMRRSGRLKMNGRAKDRIINA